MRSPLRTLLSLLALLLLMAACVPLNPEQAAAQPQQEPLVVATTPKENRQLYTYHNSFSYFARRYGFNVLGSIQPHDFSEPSEHDVTEVIDLLRELDLPAIFGSSFAPSPLMEQISREADVPIYMIDDDDLPGEPVDPEHSLLNMKVQTIKTLAEALGGDPTFMDRFETYNVPDKE